MSSRRKVLIVSESDTFFDNISSILPKEQFNPILHAKNGGEARRQLLENDSDILLIDSPLSDEHGVLFAENFSETNMGILLLVNADMYDEVCSKVEDHGIVTLPKPNSPQMFYMAVKMLAAMTLRLEKMETKNRSLQEKMNDIRTINKAKWMLIENQKMSESEAHHYIEKKAMDERLSRREAAERIIEKYEL
ncbi:ANTAR domain-containing response regulator [Treponema sp.]|uniref:ANTAR domain-containing response regulator n=1 Tax=Treponema sp. TaxID=166 RepID=UPI00298D8209|nr:ANTAR domain-containing protein [Treponema sp.]MCQ2240987.1 ANTAR domain-containing protein [Treponema sp.]